MNEVIIYTDGSCYGNPGPGGWASIILVGNRKFELSGGEDITDNNRMEMTALIEALKLLKTRYKIKIYSDSGFVIDALNSKSFKKWQKNGWISSNNKKIAYKDLWKELLFLIQNHSIQFYHVKSHSGNIWNERCDALAKAEAEKRKVR